eukprot:2511198-Lingulodinium_polyedra.AAC.1
MAYCLGLLRAWAVVHHRRGLLFRLSPAWTVVRHRHGSFRLGPPFSVVGRAGLRPCNLNLDV